MATPFIIGIAGPSGAGKTTLAEHIVAHYPAVTHIKLDGFFKTLEEFPMYGRWRNREVPENLYWDDFYEALRSLKNGRATEFPVYSKKADSRIGKQIINPSEIILVEGYLLYFDPRVRNLIDHRMFMHVSVENQYRRKKGRWPEMEDEYFFEVVVPVFNMHGAPGARHAHTHLNGDTTEAELVAEFKKYLATMPQLSPTIKNSYSKTYV